MSCLFHSWEMGIVSKISRNQKSYLCTSDNSTVTHICNKITRDKGPFSKHLQTETHLAVIVIPNLLESLKFALCNLIKIVPCLHCELKMTPELFVYWELKSNTRFWKKYADVARNFNEIQKSRHWSVPSFWRSVFKIFQRARICVPIWSSEQKAYAIN